MPVFDVPEVGMPLTTLIVNSMLPNTYTLYFNKIYKHILEYSRISRFYTILILQSASMFITTLLLLFIDHKTYFLYQVIIETFALSNKKIKMKIFIYWITFYPFSEEKLGQK